MTVTAKTLVAGSKAGQEPTQRVTASKLNEICLDLLLLWPQNAYLKAINIKQNLITNISSIHIEW